MLIFGLRVYYRTIGQGMFHCHRCGGDRPYVLRAGRRWFHIFFIPLIPLEQAGQHVQCVSCRTRYRPEVLNLPTSAQMQAALPAGVHAAALAMITAGDPGAEPARRRAVQVVSAAGVPGYCDAALAADLARPLAQAPDLAGALNPLAMQLAMPAREWFLADVVRIGLADGSLSDPEREIAHHVAAQLGMTPAQAYGVIAMTEQSAPAG